MLARLTSRAPLRKSVSGLHVLPVPGRRPEGDIPPTRKLATLGRQGIIRDLDIAESRKAKEPIENALVFGCLPLYAGGYFVCFLQLVEAVVLILCLIAAHGHEVSEQVIRRVAGNHDHGVCHPSACVTQRILSLPAARPVSPSQ